MLFICMNFTKTVCLALLITFFKIIKRVHQYKTTARTNHGKFNMFHRDANLWRPKIGRLSFCYPPGISTTPPPRKIDSAPNGNDLGHFMTYYMMYIPSKFEC